MRAGIEIKPHPAIHRAMQAVIIDHQLTIDIKRRAVIRRQIERIAPRLGHFDAAGVARGEVIGRTTLPERPFRAQRIQRQNRTAGRRRCVEINLGKAACPAAKGEILCMEARHPLGIAGRNFLRHGGWHGHRNRFGAGRHNLRLGGFGHGLRHLWLLRARRKQSAEKLIVIQSESCHCFASYLISSGAENFRTPLFVPWFQSQSTAQNGRNSGPAARFLQPALTSDDPVDTASISHRPDRDLPVSVTYQKPHHRKKIPRNCKG